MSEPGRGRLRLGPVAVSLPLLAAHVGLLFVFDLAHRLTLTLALLGAAFLGLLWAARRLEIAEALSGRALLLVALLLRLPLLPLPPTLSDDMLRYLWDGKVAAAGSNPYALAPAAEQLTPLRDEIWRRLPHTHVATIYPPLAVTTFSIASRLPFPLFSWKVMATGADLLACWLLLGVARRQGVPLGRTVWYAWNPLVALESAGMGHVDALGVAATVGVVLCLLPLPGRPRQPRQVGAAAVWAATAALAKLVPLAAFPLWARLSRSPWRFLGVAGALVTLAVAPVVVSTGGIPPGLVTYGISWEFDGPLFEPLWRLLDSIGAVPALARGLDHLKVWTHDYQTVNPLYPYLYPQLLAKLVLAAGAVAVVLHSLRQRDPVTGTGRLFGGLLLLSATVYPWYLLWVLPWAALRRQRAWLALSALILLSYLPQRAGVPVWPWVWLGIWVPFFLLLLFSPSQTFASDRPLPRPSPLPLSRPPHPPPRERGTRLGRSGCSPSSPGEGGWEGAGEEGRGDEGLGRGSAEAKVAPLGDRGEGSGGAA